MFWRTLLFTSFIIANKEEVKVALLLQSLFLYVSISFFIAFLFYFAKKQSIIDKIKPVLYNTIV